MRVHPDVARLRGEGAPQPACHAALAEWRARPEVDTVCEQLAQLAAGARFDDLPALTRLVSDHDAACAFAAGFVAPMIGAQQAEPLAHLPLGHATAPGMARLRLIEEGRACLTLTTLAPRACRASPSALFEDGSMHEMVIAGQGEAMMHRLERDAVTSERLMLAPGARLTRDGPNAARQITAITSPLLLLQVSCAAEHPGPSREIAIDDGRLITTISGCKHASQQMMALGVIGALGHRDGLGAMAALARDMARPRDLRWEALRQVLALDNAHGLAVLAALADNRADTLAAPAAALQQQLRAAHPGLAALMPEPT